MIKYNLNEWEGVWIGEGVTHREVKLFASPKSKINAETFAVGMTIVGAGQRHEVHEHEANREMIVVYDGEGILQSGGKEYPVCKGDILGFGYQENHGFINTGNEPLMLCWIYYPPGVADDKFYISHE